MRVEAVNSRTFSQNHGCGMEISSYLQDPATWGSPVIPTLPGCPDIIFNSPFNYFTQFWTCPEIDYPFTK